MSASDQTGLRGPGQPIVEIKRQLHASMLKPAVTGQRRVKRQTRLQRQHQRVFGGADQRHDPVAQAKRGVFRITAGKQSEGARIKCGFFCR